MKQVLTSSTEMGRTIRLQKKRKKNSQDTHTEITQYIGAISDQHKKMIIVFN